MLHVKFFKIEKTILYAWKSIYIGFWVSDYDNFITPQSPCIDRQSK